jgi:hypothetical protein
MCSEEDVGNEHSGRWADKVLAHFPNLVIRNPDVLSALSLRYRWEFTRRHPYYLVYWMPARDHYMAEVPDDPQRAPMCAVAAHLLLFAIGVTAAPLPPSSEWNDIKDTQPSRAVWEEGAVAPASYRAMASMLIADLPRATKLALALLLGKSAGCDDDDLFAHFDMLSELMRMREPALDAIPNRPVISVNPVLPLRATQRAVAKLKRQWSSSLGLTQTRPRPDVLEDYLAVWDLREGWTGDRYDVKRELQFKEVAIRRRLPLQTVVSQYRSAFRLLSGHDYSFLTWLKLFASEKLNCKEAPAVLSRRHRSSRRDQHRRPSIVTETNLTGGIAGRDGGKIAREATGHTNFEMIDLYADVRDLLSKGVSDKQIVLKMGFVDKQEGLQFIGDVRDRIRPQKRSGSASGAEK